MNILYAMVIAFSMYSKIPMPTVEWTKERMRYVFCFFPLIGAVIGGLMIVWSKVGMRITGNENLNAAIMMLIPVAVTGGIHLDGFLDTSDALNSYKTTEEKLEILKDSHSGAFAIIMGLCYFVLSFGAYSAVTVDTMKVLAMGFVLSRALSGLAVVTFKMAKKNGLAASFSDMAQKRVVGCVMILYVILCFLLMVLTDPVLGSICFLAAVLVFLFYRNMSYRKFGGITGDLAGFFLQVCELVMVLAVVIASNLLR